MLAVLKKRWRPRRPGGVNNLQHSINNNNNNNNEEEEGEVAGPVVSRRQVKSDVVAPAPLPLTLNTNQREKEVGGGVSPLQPNICVQQGRIEFISAASLDPVKSKLEARIAELEKQLEEEKRSTLRERRNTARFQALLQDRECLSRDVEAEREIREDCEARLHGSQREAASYRHRVHTLQTSLNRLEESLRTMSQYKNKYSQLKLENTSLRSNVEIRMQNFQSMLSRLCEENEALKAQLASLQDSGVKEEEVKERLLAVEAENQRLVQERYQCERCLDQVAHHVVKALLSQKSLREEVSTLRERIKELESQNRALSARLLQGSSSPPHHHRNHTIEWSVRPASCEESKLRWSRSCLWLPLDRPRSLNLEALHLHSSSKPDGHKDEGYSTMSSEAQAEADQPNPLTTPSTQRRWVGRSASDSELWRGWGRADWWEADWAQAHWLRLEEGRDNARLCNIDLEEWTMDDITPGGMSSVGGESTGGCDLEELWAVAESEPGGSKRSSAVASDSDAADPPATDFTSDFYRLVKFESSRSLASSSGDWGDAAAAAVNAAGAMACDELRSDLPSDIGLDSDTVEKPPSLRSLVTVPEEEEEAVAGSMTSSVSTPDTVIPPCLGEGCPRLINLNDTSCRDACAPETVSLEATASTEVCASHTCPRPTSPAPSTSLPWASTSLQLIEQLSRLEAAEEPIPSEPASPRDEGAACPTSWVRLESHLDFTDPKARESLLEVMLSNRSSSSCSSDSSEEHPDYQHLHRIHRSRRHKKAFAQRDGMGALRRSSHQRVSIIGREDLFSRFGVKEEEAIASFDFLEEFSTTSSNESTSCRP